jgi:hypothetical protein
VTLPNVLRAAAVAALLPAAACSRDRLLEVRTPDQLTPGTVASAAGAAAQRNAAIGNFLNFFAGTTNVGATLYVGLLSDELINARPGADHIDQRAFNPNTFPNLAWQNFGQAYTQLIRARRALVASPGATAADTATARARVAELYALQGMSLAIAGELFCNGVPLSPVDDADPLASDIVTNAEMFQRAVAQFDSALAGTPAADVANLARVGKGRALVDLGQWPAAAAAVAAVPTAFVYNAQFSQTSLANATFDWMVNTANFGPSDREGGNGLPFISARDPRVVVSTTSRLGQDGSTRVFTIQGYATGSAPTKLATGVEARLVEAEAALRAGDAAAALATLNAARADPGARAAFGIAAAAADPLPPLADAGAAAARVDQLFRERAFWMYLTAHRVGDLRRLVRQYARPAESVWPTGAYFKGGTYGTDQNITPNFAETNNPAWKGCADRNP